MEIPVLSFVYRRRGLSHIFCVQGKFMEFLWNRNTYPMAHTGFPLIDFCFIHCHSFSFNPISLCRWTLDELEKESSMSESIIFYVVFVVCRLFHFDCWTLLCRPICCTWIQLTQRRYMVSIMNFIWFLLSPTPRTRWLNADPLQPRKREWGMSDAKKSRKLLSD